MRLYFIFFFLLFSCTSQLLKYDKEDHLKKNDEFEKLVKIKDASIIEQEQKQADAKKLEEEQKLSEALKKNPKLAVAKKTVKVKPEPKKKSTTKETSAEVAESAKPAERQPDLEDSVGFQGRRPAVDPFRVGEVVTHEVQYFKVAAGKLKLKVEPFVEVNSRKSYTFAVELQTSSLFSKFYSVDDRVVTLVDYDELIPRVFTMHVKETGQLKEAKSFFDFEKNKATYWESKYTKNDGEQEKKEDWEILPYTQNVFSALFYMRTFKWEVGKEIAFRVSDNKENLIFKGKAIRKEKLSTAAGEFQALVIKPEIILKGQFKPVGDIFIWLSDDEHKYILRIESSIKIGTLVSEVVSIQ